ncbi:unnamed protein product [Gongylonema pulchrum]|uniref:DDE_Tnp_1_7 domain-containing protein n=1 Tax=Gongylonema pulchrum TaxID=637853 RepID=A0A183DMF6_9BILA|nr:unnamed protein product [Gongylonema pulchrum]
MLVSARRCNEYRGTGSLEGTQEKWIIDVLYAFNAGDLNKFNQYSPQWAEWDDLQKHKDFLMGKIRLLSLMEVGLLFLADLC